MKYALAVVVVAALALGGWLLIRGFPAAERTSTMPGVRRDAGAAAPFSTTSGSSTGSSGAKPSRVTRVSPEERRALGARIAAARAKARAATSSGSAPALPTEDAIKLEDVSASTLAALQASIPLLADCYAKGPKSSNTAIAMMDLFSDPDVGTVIDTDAITDEANKPLVPAVDECLRTTLEELALPPLEAGGHLKLKFSFVFDDDDVKDQ